MIGYTGERNVPSKKLDDGSQQQNFSYGTLHTDAGNILWPFKINGGGTKPTDFEIMQLDANHLKLIYAEEGTGAWGEATWWAFKSESDAEASLTNFGTKDWTWDTEFMSNGGAWGNKAYTNGNTGDNFVAGEGIWFKCYPDYLENPDPNDNNKTQMEHSDQETPLGEGIGAYMTFDLKKGLITSYNNKGAQIRQGKFEILNWTGKRSNPSVKLDDGTTQANFSYGILHTDPGSILWPFKINGGGTKPTDFEIMQLDANHLKLIYAEEGTGAWGEATWWAFKKK